MDILFAVIGVSIGGGLGYWWRGRSLTRPLPSTAVWLFPVKDEPNLWRVAFEETHNWMEPEPTLWTLPQHEHSFSLEEKHALQCKDGELIDLRCLIQVSPKRDADTLEGLLSRGSIEQLNDVSWVFQELQSTLKTSTTVVKQENREYWLSHADDLIKRWQSRLNDALPHWNCSITLEQIQATADRFYQMTDPVQRGLLLSRVEQKESLEAIETRLRLIDLRIEEEKHKQAAFEVQLAQTEQLDVKWSAFENHISKKRTRIERELQEKIEAFRTEMRGTLGLTVDSITAELNLRNAPAELTDNALEQRNDLDTILDTAKEEHLELLSQVENHEQTSNEDDNAQSDLENDTTEDADTVPNDNTTEM